MRSTEFLNEGVAKDINQMIKLIKRDCKPYLQENKQALSGFPLWRGMKSNGDVRDESGDFRKKTVRLTDRIPKDTPLELHDEMNVVLQKKYGHPYRNALFVTGSKGQTWDYGDTFVIFPIGNFEFIWHPEIRDLWYKLATALEIEQRTSITNDIRDKANYFMLKADYQTTDLESAIKARGEIMMWTKSYYAINDSVFDGLWEREEYEKELYK